LNVIGVGLYFAQSGFLNPGYLVPYQELARQIEAHAPASETLVLVDSLNSDPTPLLAALDSAYPTVVARGAGFAKRAIGEVETRRPAVVWRLGTSRDISPRRMQQTVTNQLQAEYTLIGATDYLPYSSLQSTLFELFSNREAPGAHYSAERWQRKIAE
jgi:hypothetical protein